MADKGGGEAYIKLYKRAIMLILRFLVGLFYYYENLFIYSSSLESCWVVFLFFSNAWYKSTLTICYNTFK